MKPSKISKTFCAWHATEWFDSFPVNVFFIDAMEHLYSEEAPNSSAQTKNKEEGGKRWKFVCGDWQQICA